VVQPVLPNYVEDTLHGGSIAIGAAVEPSRSPPRSPAAGRADR